MPEYLNQDEGRSTWGPICSECGLWGQAACVWILVMKVRAYKVLGNVIGTHKSLVMIMIIVVHTSSWQRTQPEGMCRNWTGSSCTGKQTPGRTMQRGNFLTWLQRHGASDALP